MTAAFHQKVAHALSSFAASHMWLASRKLSNSPQLHIEVAGADACGYLSVTRSGNLAVVIKPMIDIGLKAIKTCQDWGKDVLPRDAAQTLEMFVMRTRRKTRALCALLISSSLIAFPLQNAAACTRAVYLGPENTVITVRSMDWSANIGSNLWAFPRGAKRDGAAGPNSLQWTSKYGSVITSAFDLATADGINEKGFVANLLYLAESQYPSAASAGDAKSMSISVWAQYVLDNFATVAEAVDALRKEQFYVVPVMTPDGHEGTVHLAISDPSGDSAIFEYVKGKLVIHHGREYQVMTNSPIYGQQLALNAYWKEIGGTTMLPGTNRAADRFVRASFYINAIPKTAVIDDAVASTFSVIRNASVPLGITTPGEPNIASTLWRTVIDQKNRRYFFDSARSPEVFWVSVDDMDFTAGAPVKKLTVSDGAVFSGNAASQFKPADSMKFLVATPK